MPAEKQGRGIALSRYALQCNPPPLLFGWGVFPPAFLTDVGGILCTLAFALAPAACRSAFDIKS